MRKTDKRTGINAWVSPPPGRTWSRLLVRMLWLSLFPLTLLTVEWAAANPRAVETIYSRRVYPFISQAWGFLFGWVPFSAFEILVYAALLLTAGLVVYTLVRVVTGPHRLYRLANLVVGLALAATVLYAIFIGFWGLNYHRMPLADRLGWDARPSSAGELADLCEELVLSANAIRMTLPEDENGVVAPPFATEEVLALIPAAYEKLSDTIEWMGGQYAAPKPVLASRPMCFTEITGIFSPFTLEANVNVAVPYPLLGANAAHEAAHQRGFAREDEANFIAFMACRASDDEYLTYSGLLLAAIHAMNALYGADQDAHRTLHALYCEGIRRDLWARSVFWDQFKGPVAETATQINNTYLQSNKQQDGVMSYGRMVDLLLAERRMRTAGEQAD